jgi:hypothetical protein
MKTQGHMGGENLERGFLLFIPQVPLPQFLELLLFIIYLPYGLLLYGSNLNKKFMSFLQFNPSLRVVLLLSLITLFFFWCFCSLTNKNDYP